MSKTACAKRDPVSYGHSSDFWRGAARLLADCETHCLHIQDTLSTYISDHSILSVEESRHIQNVDRLTQTLGALADVMRSAHAAGLEAPEGLEPLVEASTLAVVRDMLLHPDEQPDTPDEADTVTLF